MKAWLFALPLLCLAPVSMADDSAPSPAAQSAPQAQKQMTAQEKARLKQRDMRHCLERKSNREIHRCIAKQRRN